MEKMTARVCIEEEKGINDGPVTNKEQTAEVDKQKETTSFNSNSNLGLRFTLPKNSGLSLNENYTLPKTAMPESPINSQESSLPLSPTINGILSCPKGIDTELNAGNDDNSPIIAPINSNSQQSQWQVFNMVNIPDKEKAQQQQ